MIKQTLYLKQYNWNVKIIYCIHNITARNLISELEYLECPKEIIEEALEYFNKNKNNCGLTYSNAIERKTVIIIFKSSSIEQLYNTCVHELYHFIRQLSAVEYSSEEDQATLIGNIFMQMLESIKELIRTL